ncbi:O-acyltransferase like protein-like [Synchiropus splendidus]|uniref:O-acyltransferase like protein-like n=1 Tax=Synchiropus splendidus TaxID=270530 RepID=UPI00237D546D|nr:O-acyltransferase like protein-like [Synchiropus splendidus]
MRDTNSFLWDLNQDNPKEYAVMMYDSYGKMGSNMVGGNVNQPGLMSECRSAHTPSFSGQYCKVSLTQGKVFYFVGICVPDSCEDTDAHMLVLEGRLKFREISLIPPLPSALINDSTQHVVGTHCLSKTVHPDPSGIACLVLCCVLVTLPLAATLITAVKNEQLRRKVPAALEPLPLVEGQPVGDLKINNTSNWGKDHCSLKEANQTNASQQDTLSHCLQQFLQAFSLQTTTQGIFSTPASVKASYPSLNGIRALSLLWIISGHALRLIETSLVDNRSTLQASEKTSPLHVFTDSGNIYLAVDSFLLLGGLLSAKSLLNSIQRNDDTMSPSLVADYYFKRIRRIQPLHMFVLLLYVGFTSVFSGGPYGDVLQHQCGKYWWTNLLLINNLFTIRLSCLPWTWYLSLDMQCYVTTPLLILAHRKNKVVFVILVVGFQIMTVLTGFFFIANASQKRQAWHESKVSMSEQGLTRSASLFRSTDDFLFFYYYKPYSRCGPFVIGILFGMYLKLRKESFLKKKWQAALGWMSSLSVLALVVGLGFFFYLDPDRSATGPAFYHGLHRILWVTALSWVILACEEGYGGFITSLLSLKFWVPLANLSYSSYLIHPFIIYIFIGLQETPVHYLDINGMYLFFGHVVLTIPVSYVLTVLVERPFILLKWKIGGFSLFSHQAASADTPDPTLPIPLSLLRHLTEVNQRQCVGFPSPYYDSPCLFSCPGLLVDDTFPYVFVSAPLPQS